MSVLEKLVGLLAPHECLGCGNEGRLLCPSCLKSLPPAKVPAPHTSHLSKIQSVTLYEGLAKDLIWKLKSDGAQAAAYIMASAMAELLRGAESVCLVPVPTAVSRVRQRGYDQAKLIARSLARQTGFAYANYLIRCGQAHQVGANRLIRLQQIGGAFRVRQVFKLKGAKILLIDDVTTTGATLDTAAELLKTAGAASVKALTFAYAEPPANQAPSACPLPLYKS